MANSFVEHLGDGQTPTFAVPFPYLYQKDVKVAVGGVATSSFTWDSPNLIRVTPTPAKDAVVKVYRDTEKTKRLVDFEDDSIQDEALLDEMAKQLFYIVQEAYDLSATSIVVVEDGHYDARERRVKRVADPIELTDAVNLRTFQSDFLPRLQAEANRAEAAANTSLALKSDFDAKWLGLLQKEQDFNTSYSQVRTWEGQVAANKDATNADKQAVQAMKTSVESTKAAVDNAKQAFDTKVLSDNTAFDTKVADAHAAVDAKVATATNASNASTAAAGVSTSKRDEAVTAATQAKASEVAAATYATTAQSYKLAMDAVGVDAVALQNAVTAAEAAAARAEGASAAQVNWSVITDKPAAFPPSTHGHAWGDISGKPTEFTPSAHGHSWSDIAGKPTEFAPAAHTHSWTTLSDKPVLFSGAYADLSGRPTAFPPTAHGHSWDDVVGKPTVFPSDWSQVGGKPSTYPPAAHNHDGVYLKQSRITISTADPSGGVDGDIWFKHAA